MIHIVESLLLPGNRLKHIRGNVRVFFFFFFNLRLAVGHSV
jgi:hypothetical protein